MEAATKVAKSVFMTKRRSISQTMRVRIFERHNGICEFCEQKIQVGEAWEVSHSIPLECGGADDESNMRPAHKTCHRKHTSEVDAPAIAKVKRIHAKHIGAKPKRSWNNGWKRKMDGTIVDANGNVVSRKKGVDKTR